MNAYNKQRQVPLGNPLANVLVVIVGALAIGVSLVLGFFAFLVLGSIVLVMAAIIGIRLWWFQRQMRKNSARSPHRPDSAAPGGIIEGEFKVVSGDTRRDPD